MLGDPIDRPLGAVFLGLSAVLLGAPLAVPAATAGVLVEVHGTVGLPGWHRVDPPTLWAALEAAHGDARGTTDRRLDVGDGVWVGPDGPVVVPVSQPLLLGQPLSVEHSPEAAFADLPGVTADDVASLGRPGSLARRDPPGRIARWSKKAPHAVVAPAPRAIDVNRASAAELELLPGIGPALAGRIVAHRAANGAFREVAGLDAVSGIGPATLARLLPLVTVGEASPR
jgi:competence protein ComEA